MIVRPRRAFGAAPHRLADRGADRDGGGDADRRLRPPRVCSTSCSAPRAGPAPERQLLCRSVQSRPRPRARHAAHRPASPARSACGCATAAISRSSAAAAPTRRSSAARSARPRETKMFSGGGIDHAVASDGTRYADLPQRLRLSRRDRRRLHLQRPRPLWARDAERRARTRPCATATSSRPTRASSPTTAAAGGNAEFTPIASYPGLSAEWRERLAQTRIAPNNATPIPPETLRRGAAAVHDDRGRRVQLDR